MTRAWALALASLASAHYSAAAATGRPVEWRVQGLDEVRLEALIRDADNGVAASGPCQRASYKIVVTLDRASANEPALKVEAAVRFHPLREAFVVEPIGSTPGEGMQFDKMATLLVHGRRYPIDDPEQGTRAEGCGDL